MIGRTLGPYEVVAKLGEGGMGEVYRARDQKLNRDVALKVLPASVADDPDRLARFKREAQVLASLNQPNIAAIYGFEDSGPTHALVLELVEGPTLADRISAGPLPCAEAIAIAKQVADALAAAHEVGIIHRDLKPANIKVRDDGTVKVLDFGLAKALAPDASSPAPSAMNSPTLTARATELGMIIGTAAYMAPEQARGKAVDRRADLWAFGVVLYEMLIRPYPDVGRMRIPVTTDGGTNPVWGADGRTLYFDGPGNTELLMVTVEPTGDTLSVGRPAPFATVRDETTAFANASLPPVDGRVLGPARDEAETRGSEYRVVLNWFEELRTRLAR